MLFMDNHASDTTTYWDLTHIQITFVQMHAQAKTYNRGTMHQNAH